MSLKIVFGIAAVAAMALGCNQILGNQLIGLASDGGEPSTLTGGDATTADAHAQKDAAADATADSGPGYAPDAPPGIETDAADGGCGPLTDIHSCGSCTNDCSQLLNVSTAGLGCSAGRCTYDCAPNYADCAEAGIGCGTALTTARNCGACGATCPTSTPLCSSTDAGAYACVSGCSAGQTNCTGTCSDLSMDPHHCGDCATACTSPESCVAGKCQCPTAASPDLCAAGCTNLQTDSANCGSCGHACTGGETCQAGTCACAANQTLCNGTCVSTQSDVANCGACGSSCAQLPHVLTTGLSCTAGVCGYQCQTGFSDCANTKMGCTTNLSTTMTCGSCTTACSGMTPVCQAVTTSTFGCTSGCMTGQSNCSGTCTTLATDPSNCGKCGIACPAAEVCQAGTCQCPTTAKPSFCNGACTNILSDSANCGACGTVCSTTISGATSTCDGTGHCTTATCGSGQMVCGASCTNAQTDPSNCGRCGHSCQGGTCSGGVCQPVVIAPATSTNFIAGVAVDANFVYWTEQQDIINGFAAGWVRKAPIGGGGSFTTLAGSQASPFNIAVNATGLFWIDQGATQINGGLMFLAANGVSAVNVASAFNQPVAMALTSSSVYWFDTTAIVAQSEQLLSLSMSNLTAAATPAEITGAAVCAVAMASNGSQLFWLQTGCFAGSGSVMSASIPPTAASFKNLLPGGTFLNGPYAAVENSAATPANIGLSGGTIYFGSSGASAQMLESIPITAGFPTTISSTAAPNGIAADSTNVYWTDVTTVKSMPLGGGTVTTLASGQTAPYAIAVDANSVYWGNNSAPGGVMKVAKP